MKPDFTIEPYVQKVDKPWGYELNFVKPEKPYSSKMLHILAGKRLSFQYHDQKSETGVLVHGQCHLLLEDNQGQFQEVNMESLKGYTIIPSQKHRYIAVTDCDVFESSTPEIGNTIRLEDDYQRPTETEELRNQPNRGWHE